MCSANTCYSVGTYLVTRDKIDNHYHAACDSERESREFDKIINFTYLISSFYFTQMSHILFYLYYFSLYIYIV